jgi:hypothetical protein
MDPRDEADHHCEEEERSRRASVSEQPADLLQGRGETTQFVVKINQELCVLV